MEVKFHDIGEGMTEGEILQYFVAIGDEVAVDEPLVEVQTDKMVAELPSPTAGIVKAIHFDLGEEITVGTTVLEIDDGKEETSEQPASEAPSTEDKVEKEATSEITATRQTSTKANTGAVLAAPFTRKIARDHHVDIEQIQGTGPDGRVLEEDVYAFIEEGDKERSDQRQETGTASKESIPFKGIRKEIAKNITRSAQIIPHVTHYEEVDVTALTELRNELKAMDKNVSIVAFFIKSLAIALKDYPIFNAELDEEKEVIRLYEDMNIGLATDTEAGLVVPVLHHVETMSLQEIHEKMKQLTEKAQEGKLSRSDMSGGTFSISNVGPLGGVGATPIINYPQSAIMAFHKTVKTPVVLEDDQVEVRSIMNISLSFDHRLADGADSVRFTNRFKELVETPKKLFMELT